MAEAEEPGAVADKEQRRRDEGAAPGKHGRDSVVEEVAGRVKGGEAVGDKPGEDDEGWAAAVAGFKSS